jgi:hypothetical protein
MGTRIGTTSDVVSFLKRQHAEMRILFEDVLSTRGKARAYAFSALRRLLAVHETAEEEIVHPVARRAIADGEAIVAVLLREEREAKQDLSELEKLDVDSYEFETKLLALRARVFLHTEAEESDEFERLATTLEPERLEQMRRAVEFAEAVAPTRPHPALQTLRSNVVAGPAVAVFDRVRDAISGKAPS